MRVGLPLPLFKVGGGEGRVTSLQGRVRGVKLGLGMGLGEVSQV